MKKKLLLACVPLIFVSVAPSMAHEYKLFASPLCLKDGVLRVPDKGNVQPFSYRERPLVLLNGRPILVSQVAGFLTYEFGESWSDACEKDEAIRAGSENFTKSLPVEVWNFLNLNYQGGPILTKRLLRKEYDAYLLNAVELAVKQFKEIKMDEDVQRFIDGKGFGYILHFFTETESGVRSHVDVSDRVIYINLNDALVTYYDKAGTYLSLNNKIKDLSLTRLIIHEILHAVYEDKKTEKEIIQITNQYLPSEDRRDLLEKSHETYEGLERNEQKHIRVGSFLDLYNPRNYPAITDIVTKNDNFTHKLSYEDDKWLLGRLMDRDKFYEFDYYNNPPREKQITNVVKEKGTEKDVYTISAEENYARLIREHIDTLPHYRDRSWPKLLKKRNEKKFELTVYKTLRRPLKIKQYETDDYTVSEEHKKNIEESLPFMRRAVIFLTGRYDIKDENFTNLFHWLYYGSSEKLSDDEKNAIATVLSHTMFEEYTDLTFDIGYYDIVIRGLIRLAAFGNINTDDLVSILLMHPDVKQKAEKFYKKELKTLPFNAQTSRVTKLITD